MDTERVMKLGSYTCTVAEAKTIAHYGFRPEEIRVAHPWQYVTTYSSQMKAAGELVSVNTKPCRRGHTVRTRRGHCVVCNPQSLHHLQLHSIANFVYLAASKRSGHIKIGVTGNTNDREASLNSQRYGGNADWRMLRWTWVGNAGAVKHELLGAITQGTAPTGIGYRLTNEARAHEAYEVDANHALKVWSARFPSKCVT